MPTPWRKPADLVGSFNLQKPRHFNWSKLGGNQKWLEPSVAISYYYHHGWLACWLVGQLVECLVADKPPVMDYRNLKTARWSPHQFANAQWTMTHSAYFMAIKFTLLKNKNNSLGKNYSCSIIFFGIKGNYPHTKRIWLLIHCEELIVVDKSCWLVVSNTPKRHDCQIAQPSHFLGV